LRLFIVGLAESVQHEFLGLLPWLKTKHPAPFVDRYRLAKCFDAGILQCVCKLLQAGKIKPVRPRHDDTCNGVPDADEFDRGPSHGKDTRELRRLILPRGGASLIKFGAVDELARIQSGILMSGIRAELLVGGQAGAGEIALRRRYQSNLVD